MRAAWLICLKDLKARLRDRSALLIELRQDRVERAVVVEHGRRRG